MQSSLVRRSFLYGSVASFVVLGSKNIAWCMLRSQSRVLGEEPLPPPTRITSLAVIGNALKQQSPDTFTQLQSAALAELGHRKGLDARSVERFLTPARNELDFDEGKMIVIDGWVVSASEATACVVATLVEGSGRCS